MPGAVKMIKKLSSIIMCGAVLAACLTGCGLGIKKDEATEHIKGFFAAVEDGNFEDAEAYLHPDKPDSLEEFFSAAEDDKSVDFQSGIEIETYKFVSSSVYDSDFGGSQYTTTVKTKIGDREIGITVRTVRNDNGFGIYDLKFEAD